MATKTIAFINEKGGIGKTSCAFNIAWEMAKTNRILLIDLDGQKANLTYFCGVGKAEDMITMLNVLTEGTDPSDAIVTIKENLDLIPANTNLANIGQTAKISRMKRIIKDLADSYDYIFIDVNPTPNWTHVLALSAADYVIVPMLPDVTSLEASDGLKESVEEIKETANPNLKVMGLLFNKNINTTVLSREVKESAAKRAHKLSTEVFASSIRNATVLGECVSMHKGITDYAPRSAAAMDVKEVIQEIERRV